MMNDGMEASIESSRRIFMSNIVFQPLRLNLGVKNGI